MQRHHARSQYQQHGGEFTPSTRTAARMRDRPRPWRARNQCSHRPYATRLRSRWHPRPSAAGRARQNAEHRQQQGADHGITHWHQLNAVAKRSQASCLPHSRATSNDSTGGATSAHSAASRSASAPRPAAAQQHQYAAHQRKGDQRRQARQERVACRTELPDAVGPAAGKADDAEQDVASLRTAAASVVSSCQKGRQNAAIDAARGRAIRRPARARPPGAWWRRPGRTPPPDSSAR